MSRATRKRSSGTRPSRFTVRLTQLLVPTVWALPQAAFATPTEREVAYVGYSAPEGCPDETEFLHDVQQRLRHGQLARNRLAGRSFFVEITRKAGIFEGQVRRFVDDPHPRDVEGKSCTEAARALCLIVALAIDDQPDARTDGPVEATTTTSLPTTPIRQVAVSKQRRPSKRPRTGPAKSHSLAPPEDDARDEGKIILSSANSWAENLAVGVRAFVDTPKAPRALPGLELFSELVLPDRISVVLAVGAQPQQEVTVEGGQARFSWFGGHAATCYEFGARKRRFVFSPCLFMELGRVSARGVVDRPREVQNVWLAAGAVARIGVITNRIRSLFELGPVLPILGRTEYVFETSNTNNAVSGPDTLVHKVPTVAIFGSVSMAISVNAN